MQHDPKVSRRAAIATTAFGLGSLAAANALGVQEAPGPTYCAFVKFLQSLSHEALAKAMKAQGFDGIEATIRAKGQVEPARVEEELPALVDALGAEGLSITIMASDVNRADDSTSETVLRTAAKLGVKRYRMKYYRYEPGGSLRAQLKQLKPVVRDLAALNAELGLQAVYQNHSGARNVGAPVWDLAELLENVDPRQVGVAFDIRHATVEGGLSWPLSFRRVREHLGAVYVKDFVWDRKRRRPQNVPLGEGLVDPAFFRQLKASKFHGPISLHIEYLGGEGVEPNLQAMDRDFGVLRRLMRT